MGLLSQTDEVTLGALKPSTTWGDYNNILFVVMQALAKMQTATIVKIMACSNSGDASPVGTVDIMPMVNQVDGSGNPTPHGTIYNIPYFRIQGGANAVILDPQVGDLGIAVFASRDISNVKSTKAQANPGSWRQYDWGDGMYLGGLLNGTPNQFIQFSLAGIVVSVPPAATATIQTGDELSSVIVDDDNVRMDSSDVDITAEIGEIDLTGEVYTDQNLHVGSGATGTFSTSTGQTVTVQDGIVIDLG
jgi:hypothetical protein